MEKQSLYKYKQGFERDLQRIKDSKEISKENKKSIIAFKDYLLSEGIGLKRINRYFYELVKFNRLLKKPFTEANKNDIRRVVAIMEQTDLSPETKKCFKTMIRKLYRFLRGVEEKNVYPEEVRWITTHIPINNRKLPEELLSEEEIQQIVRRCKTLRDKALILTLAESGCRVSEIGTMQIKHVSFEEYGTRLHVNGKTGMRKILVVNSTPYLQEWINQHPFNDDPNSYLWIDSNGKLICYQRIDAILKDASKRAGIKKRVHLHLLRHSRATLLARKMSDATMKHYFGWTQGSKMATTYIHMSGKDTDEAILEFNGIEMKKEIKKSAIRPKLCLRCKTSNISTNKFCKLCGLILDKEEAENVLVQENDRKSMDNLLDNLVKDKEMMAMLVSKFKTIAKEG